MKLKIAVIFLAFSFSTIVLADTQQLQQQYPHWDLNNKQQYETIVKLNEFITKYKNQGNIAIFDWDGTLCSQQIPYEIAGRKDNGLGIIAWLAWSLAHIGKPGYDYLFPMFQTADGEWVNNILSYVRYISGHSNIKTSMYQLLSSLAAMQAGMTQSELDKSFEGYLHQYPSKQYAFLPMLDVLQNFTNSGFNVWIVSGSNGYYISAVLHDIERSIYYHPNKHYHFALTHASYKTHEDHIIGNQAKLMPNGKFSMVFDNSFTKNDAHELYIIGDYGKALAIKGYIQAKFHKPALFYAGNDDGDVAGMSYVLQQSGTLAIAVNPDKALGKLVTQYSDRVLVVGVGSSVKS